MICEWKGCEGVSTLVVTGASLLCPFGTVPSTLNVTSQVTVMAEGKPVGTITDVQMGANISGFGMCTSMANPQVAAATAAALGVLTPQPCMLVPAGPWIPGSPKFVVGGKPCLCTGSNLTCGNGMGTISIINPGQMKVTVS